MMPSEGEKTAHGVGREGIRSNPGSAGYVYIVQAWNPKNIAWAGARTVLLGRGHEFLRQLGAGAKKVLLHLLDEELLRLRLPGLQAVFVQQHLGVLRPHL